MSKAQWDSAMAELQKDMEKLKTKLYQSESWLAAAKAELEQARATRYVECPKCGTEVEAKP